MNDTLKGFLKFVGTVVVALILVAIFHIGAVNQVIKKLGSAVGITNVTSLEIDTGWFLRSNTAGGTAFQTVPSIGTCNTASSTAFAVSNPFFATSTASVVMVNGLGNATSSLFEIGTSTVSTGLTTSLISPTLVNATLATSSANYSFASGVTVGSIGYVSAGSGTFGKIMVGPNDYVSAYSTSTYSGVGALNYTPSPCTYKIMWEN